jgi:hypothetical protein
VAQPSQSFATETAADGKETFRIGVPKESTVSVPTDRPTPPPIILEEDDLNAPVSVGTICRRKGCGVVFVSDEVNRHGDGEGTVCRYHPLPVSY